MSTDLLSHNTFWSISGFLAQDDAVFNFIDLVIHENNKYHPVIYVSENLNLKWSLCQPNPNIVNLDKLNQTLEEYSKRHVGVYLDFSNHSLKEEDLNDKDCNFILDALNNFNGEKGVILANDLLSKYIKNKYPDMKQIASINKIIQENGKGNADYYKQLESKFDKIVLHPDDNENFELLDKLNRDKIEILVNESCQKNCVNRKQHYDLMSELAFNDNKILINEQIAKLKNECAGNIYTKDFCFLDFNTIDILCNMGFKHFKLDANTSASNCIFDLTKYIIKNKYQNTFYRKLFILELYCK